MIDDDEVKNDLFDNEGDLKKCNTGSMFAPYAGCAVFGYKLKHGPPCKNCYCLSQ
jgi:hypothetical protein